MCVSACARACLCSRVGALGPCLLVTIDAMGARWLNFAGHADSIGSRPESSSRFDCLLVARQQPVRARGAWAAPRIHQRVPHGQSKKACGSGAIKSARDSSSLLPSADRLRREKRVREDSQGAGPPSCIQRRALKSKRQTFFQNRRPRIILIAPWKIPGPYVQICFVLLE